MKEITLGIDGMTLEDLVCISREGAKVRLAEVSEKRILEARRLIETWIQQGKTIYGVTTGFGALSDVIISRKDTPPERETLWTLKPFVR
jgi:histidine ammonia-lyase